LFIPFQAKKIDTKNLLNPVQDRKEKERIEDKTHEKPAPPADAGSGNEHVREPVGSNDSRQDPGKKHHPFLDVQDIHG